MDFEKSNAERRCRKIRNERAKVTDTSTKKCKEQVICLEKGKKGVFEI